MEELAVFDPLKSKFPVGVVSKGENVKFSFEANINCLPNEAFLMIKFDGENDYKFLTMEKNGSVFSVTETFFHSGHYFYNFKLCYNDFEKYLSKTEKNFSIVLSEKGEDFFQLVTEKKYKKNTEICGGIIYQIFVDRFCKIGDVKVRSPFVFRDDWGGKIKKNTSDPVKINEEVFGGNFEGIISKLDYLKSLGTSAIYLSPISTANSNHKYDTANYLEIDEMFGGEELFKKLIFEAKKRDIKIIIDGVYNHTGSDSVYFNKLSRFDSVGAFNSKNSKYFEWYSFENYPEKYDCWWGIVTLPSIRDDATSFQNFIAGENGVIEKFLKLGVFGIRLDVVDEISDDFTQKISEKIKSFGSEKFVLGEVWEDAATKISYSKRRHYFSKNQLTSVMNYPLKNAIIDFVRSKNTDQLVSTLRMILNNYPKEVYNNLMNFLGTHDTERIFSELTKITLGDKTLAKTLYKISLALLFTLPGIPTLFYGDEYLAENNDGSSRGCFDWENNEKDIFEYVQKLSLLRKITAVQDGSFEILLAEGGKFVFERLSQTEHIVVLSNLGSTPLQVELSGNFLSFFQGSKVDNFSLSHNSVEILLEISSPC